MRFSKRIKIAKGVRVNLSASGASLSLGGKGASVTIGKRGTYLNTSIAGTGLSHREKLSSSSFRRKIQDSNDNQKIEIEVSWNVSLNDKGKPILTVFNSLGNKINNENIIRKVKKEQAYKDAVTQAMKAKKEEVNNNLKKFIEIYKSTPQLIKESEIKKELIELRPRYYTKKIFSEKLPTIEQVEDILLFEAEEEISTILFWRKKKLIKEFVDANKKSRLAELIEHRGVKEKQFNLRQQKTEEKQNKLFLQEFQDRKNILENIVKGNQDYVNSQIEIILSDITLPVDFSVNYQYNLGKSMLYVDLDLPEIEDMPTEKINVLASGNISVKRKTQKELKHDYAQCVTGIAFYFSGLFFNISTKIQTIEISGFTQRLNKKIGNIEDEYVYSVRFERDIFKNLNYENIDPIEALENFENVMNITKTFELKTIKPFIL